MSTSDREMFLEIMRTALIQRIDGNQDVGAVANASFKLWQQMSAKLEPMIGARGVDVLFNRALHLTSTSYPWLSIAAGQKKGDSLLGFIKSRFAAQDAAIAVEASQHLLVTFVDLLGSLIGESLTKRLLGPLWTAQSQKHNQEGESLTIKAAR